MNLPVRVVAITAVLLVAVVLYAQTPLPVEPLPQQSSPVRLAGTVNVTAGTVADVVVQNDAAATLVAYRLGWAAVYGGAVLLQQGPVLNIPAGVPAGGRLAVPAQVIPTALFQQASAPQAIGLYVADAWFSDHSHWNANPTQVRAQADNLVPSLQPPR